MRRLPFIGLWLGALLGVLLQTTSALAHWDMEPRFWADESKEKFYLRIHNGAHANRSAVKKELEVCFGRRGETTDVFFADTPTLRYLPRLYYWLGRSREAAGATEAARAGYEQFLKLRTQATFSDPLVVDATQRLEALPPPKPKA